MIRLINYKTIRAVCKKRKKKIGPDALAEFNVQLSYLIQGTMDNATNSGHRVLKRSHIPIVYDVGNMYKKSM